MLVARRYLIDGHVQGVGFRYFAEDVASREGISGWVRNLPDGRVEAAIEGARLRIRPILMTSFAFIFGSLPLAIAVGAGAGARRSLGTAVVFGMLAATLMGIYFIPTFYVWLQRLAERKWPFREERGAPPRGGGAVPAGSAADRER